jgi:hypothetical protein
VIENKLKDFETAIAWIIRETEIEVQPFRRGKPFGIANANFKIPNMISEIVNLKFRASARMQGHTSIDRVPSVFLMKNPG